MRVLGFIETLLMDFVCLQVIGGSLVNLVTVFILILAMAAWITPFYNLNEFPEVFLTAKNSSLVSMNETKAMANASYALISP